MLLRACGSVFFRLVRNEWHSQLKIGKTLAQAVAVCTWCIADHLIDAGTCCDERCSPMYAPHLAPYRRREYGWHMDRLYADFCYATRSAWIEPLDLATEHFQLLRVGYDVLGLTDNDILRV